jgi:hypothetical protein
MVARAACHVNNGSVARTYVIEDICDAPKYELDLAEIMV